MKKLLKVKVFENENVIYSFDCVYPDSFAHILALFADRLTKVVYEVYEVDSKDLSSDEK